MTFASNITPLRPVSRGPVPRLIPDNHDDLLERRWDARLLAEHAYVRTSQPYEVLRRQAEFEQRLDRIVARRAAE